MSKEDFPLSLERVGQKLTFSLTPVSVQVKQSKEGNIQACWCYKLESRGLFFSHEGMKSNIFEVKKENNIFLIYL